MPAVVGNGVAGEYPAHKRGDTRRTAAHEQVGMIAHQRPGVNCCIRLLGNPPQTSSEILTIQVVVDDLSPLDAADDDVMQRSRCVQSCAAWHLSYPLQQDRLPTINMYPYQGLYSL